MRRIHVLVGGRVQGVFFRVTCAEQARTSGLAGWVRNTKDGRVEAEFEGPDADVVAMIAWCREGPPGAEVRAVDVQDVPANGATGFRITG
jgi:acylphosphatase